MSETVNYFGYGANRDPRMIAAITGKRLDELDGKSATLRDFNLAIQELDQIPDSVTKDSLLPVSPRRILEKNWGESFRSYVIFPKLGSIVVGTLWKLSAEDRERVRDWELVGDWYKDDEGVVDTDQGEVQAITESLGDGQDFGTEINGSKYATWLQPPEQFERIATIVREEYDERIEFNRY